MFISPMLARPLPPEFPFKMKAGEWAAEIKYDGHRLIAEISDGLQPSLFVNKGVHAWSRYGLERALPTHLLEAMVNLPNGLFDGELIVPGKRSFGVTELGNSRDLVYVIFDVLQFEGDDLTICSYKQRREILEALTHCFGSSVWIAPKFPVYNWNDVIHLRDTAWEQGQEGLILKRLDGVYEIGKRSKNLIKIKDKQSKVLTVIAWAESRGEIDYRGKWATAIIRDEEGFTTTVKTKNNVELAKLETEYQRTGSPPFLGRALRIEFQERTPDGSYRHPRWDRWENE